MKLFNFKNKRHVEILREELRRVKQIMSEGSSYSEDEIWDAMSEDERWDAITTVRDDEGPDDADRYAAEEWDNIPDWLTDRMNLADFQLAKYNQGGRTNLRAIEKFSKQEPDTNKFVVAYLKKIGRNEIYRLTVKQSYDLLKKMHAFRTQMNPSSTGDISVKSDINPYDMPGGRPSGNWTGD
jgi:hypothetical protein